MRRVTATVPDDLANEVAVKAANDPGLGRRTVSDAVRYALRWYLTEDAERDNGVQLALEEIDGSDYVRLLDNTHPDGCDDCHELAVALLHVRRRLTRPDIDKGARSNDDALIVEAKRRYHYDPVFHAKAHMAAQLAGTMDRDGLLTAALALVLASDVDLETGAVTRDDIDKEKET